MMSGTDCGRSSSVDKIHKYSKTRKEWIETLSVCSSDEYNSDVILDNKIDTNQLVAIRFPYPMVSDDSDDEEDLNNYTIGLNRIVSTGRKKRHISSSSDEHSKHILKRKRMKLSHYNKIILQNKQEKPSVLENNLSKIKHPLNNNENLKHKGTYKPVETSHIIYVSSSSDISDEDEKEHKENKLLDKLKTEDISTISKFTSSVDCETGNIQEGSSRTNVNDHHLNQENEKNQTMKNSRFLNSSSGNTTDEDLNPLNKILSKPKPTSTVKCASKYKRLHMLSSSDSDSDETVVNRTVDSSNTSKYERTYSRFRKEKIIHFMSASSEEENDKVKFTSKESNNMNKENEKLPQIIPKENRPSYSLVNSFNQTESQQLDKEESSSKQIESKTLTAIFTQNSAAWKQIARHRNKISNPKTSQKLQDLKKKFATSNISSVEVHKQVQNKPLRKNNQVKQTLLETKNMKNNVSLISTTGLKDVCSDNSNVILSQDNYRENEIKNNHERSQTLENKSTVTSSGKDSIHNSNSHHDLGEINPSECPTLDRDVMLQGDKDETAVEHKKVVRISRIHPKNNKHPIKSLTLLKKNKPSHINKTHTKRKNCDKPIDNQIKTDSNQCDLLSSILTQMTNNPYKIEKHTKKVAETKPDCPMRCSNPLIFGTKTSVNTAMNSKIIAQNGVQSSLINSSFNNSGAVNSICTSNNTSLISQSNTGHKKNTCNVSTNINTKHQETNPGGSNTKYPVIMKFYSADSHEYTSESSKKDDSVQQTPQENRKLCNKQMPKNNILNHKEEVKQPNKEKLNESGQTLLKDKITSSSNVSVNSKENAAYKGKKADSCIVTEELGDKPVTLATEIESVEEESTAAQKLDNAYSGNDSNMGIRIKLGETIFRLPGRISPLNINKRSSHISSPITVSHEIGETSSNNTESINVTNEKDVNNDTMNPNATESWESGVSSDSSNVSDESSSDSSDCSTISTKTNEEKQLSEKVDNSELPTNAITKEINQVKPNISNNDDEVIILSDSSDSENEAVTNHAMVNKIDDSDKTTACTTIHDSSVKCIGKIRVKSLKDLGVNVENSCPGNALATVCSPIVTSTQQHLQVDPIFVSTGNPPVCKTGDLNLYKKIGSKQIVNTNIESVINSVIAQAYLPSASMPETTLSKDRAEQFCPTDGSVIVQSACATKSLERPINIKSTNDLVTARTSISSASASSMRQSKVRCKPSKVISNSVIAHTSTPSASTPRITESRDNPNQIRDLSTVVPLSSIGSAEGNRFNFVPITEGVASQIKKNESAQQVGTETMFFHLCDTLFIDIVLLKIPKLVEDLHLAIIHFKIKEDLLKKVDQLISPETIAFERHRAEKDFNEMIKIRSQSFVPLFITIVNKIPKDDFITLVTALYCRIIHQLVKIDPVNAEYRFKLKDIIKFMLKKHSSPDVEKVLVVFNSDEYNFINNYNFVEKLLIKYDTILEERQTLQKQPSTNNNQNLNTTSGNVSNFKKTSDEYGSNNSTESSKTTSKHIVTSSSVPSVDTAIASALQPPVQTPKPVGLPESNKTNTQTQKNQGNSSNGSSNNSTPKPSVPPVLHPLIGNLDSLLFKKTSVVRNTR